MASAASSARRSPSTSSSGSAARRPPGPAAAASSSAVTRAAPGRRSRRRSCAASSPPAGSPSLGGVLPTPAVALLAQDLGVVLSASHNPPEYNGVKLFDAEGHKLSDADEEAIEALLDDAGRPTAARSRRPRTPSPATSSTSWSTSAPPLDGLRIAVDCANGAFSAIAPGVFEQLGAEVTTVAAAPDGDEHQRRLRRHRPRPAAGRRADRRATTSASRSTVTATGCSRSTRPGAALDGDQILAVLALALGVDTVAVTTMTNLGFHRLMAERGHPRAHDRRRRPARAGRAARRGRRARRRAVGSRHLARRPRHRRRPGGGAAALQGARRRLAGGGGVGAGAPRRRRSENIRVAASGRLAAVVAARWRGSTTSSPAGAGSSSAPPGTEPLVRVLVESETEEEAAALCGRVAHLVRSEPDQ